MQIVFLTVIHFIGNGRVEINKVIHRRSFASKYILRKNDFCQACLNAKKIFIDKRENINNNLEKDINNIIKKDMVTESENIDNVDISLQIFDTKRKDVPNDENLIKKSPLNFVKRNIPKNNIVLDESIDFLEKSFDMNTVSLENSAEIRNNINKLLDGKEGMGYLADSGCYLTTEEYIRCIYEWVTSTGSSLDWLILTNLLNEQWSSFGIFGIEFSDGKALRNAIAVTSAIITSGSFMSEVTEFLFK